MAELIITIAPSGETSMEVNGVKGPGCHDVTKSLEDALGVILKSNRKPEYNDCPEAGCSSSGL